MEPLKIQYDSGTGPRWQPPAGLPAHDGDPIPESRVFFEPPPEWVGPIRSAYSTLRAWERPRPMGVRLAWAAAVAVAVVAAISTWVGRVQVPVVVMGLAAGGVVLYRTRFHHVCSYVGRDGAARFKLASRPDAPAAVETFAFADATDLWASERELRHQMQYAGTTYDCTWTAADGRRVFQLQGQRDGKQGASRRGDPWWFADEVMAAWRGHRERLAVAEVASAGHLDFATAGGQRIRLGPGYLEVMSSGRSERVTAAQLHSVTRSGEVVDLYHTDATGFGGAGRFRLQLDGVANTWLFLAMFARLVGRKL
jgi:hypothetical protein